VKALKPTVPLSRVVLLLLIAIQAALYGLMWAQVLDDSNLKTMDFVSLYGAGRLGRAGEYERLYDLEAQARVQRQVVASDDYSPLIFNHPPYFVPRLAAISVDDYVTAYILWTLARLAILALCAALIFVFWRGSGWEAGSAMLGMAGCLLFFPIFISLLGGQDTVFTLVGLLAWMFALLKKDDISAGLGLALATLSPTIAGALALPLLAARRRAGLWFLAGTAGLAAYSLWLVGVQGIKGFIRLLGISSQAQSYGFNRSGMYNLLGILTRNAPTLDPELARRIAWGAAFLSILILCIWWWKEREHLGVRHIGIAVLAVTFTSPHLNLHALSALLLPLLALMTILWERGHRTSALLFTPAVSTALMLIFIVAPDFSYAASHVLMAVLAYGLCSNPSPARRVSVE